MYLLSKISPESMRFFSGLSSSGGNRTTAFSIAIGHSLAQSLALPPAAVSDLSAYYRLQHINSVVNILNTMNEAAPFDTKLARKLVEDFYSYRYRAAHPPVIPLAVRQGQGVADLFGLTQFFSNEILETINTDCEKLTCYISGLTMLFKELRERELKAQTDSVLQEKAEYVA